MTPKEEISHALKKVLKEIGFDTKPLIERPRNELFGDYTTNIAFFITQNKEEAFRLARELTEKLKKEDLKNIDKIEAIAGFINFHLSEDFLREQVLEIIKKNSKYGSSTLGKGKTAQVEFISANPTGPLTLGNGRGGFTGDAIANVLEKVGYEIEREYYVNDVGFQIGWVLGASMKKKLEPNWQPGGNVELYTGEYIMDLARKFKKKYSDFPGNWTPYGEKAAKIILEEMIKKTIDKMKINHGKGFDNYFYESSLYQHNENAVRLNVLKKLEEEKLVYEKDSATFFRTTKFGDDKDRVIKKSVGKHIWEYTYFFSDIMHKAYIMGPRFDKLILVLGADHQGYQSRMNAAMEAFGQKGKLSIIIIQLVRLIKGGKEIKISKRRDYQKYFELENLIDEVGSDVARFFFVSHAPESHMDFDLDLAKKKAKENPVFYVQYAYARISSIFEKIHTNISLARIDTKILKEPEEIELMRQLVKFPEIIEDISQSLHVHLLPAYSLQLASLFHKFYEQHTILEKDGRVYTRTSVLSSARLALIKATQIVLKEGLYLLGIEAPSRM